MSTPQNMLLFFLLLIILIFIYHYFNFSKRKKNEILLGLIFFLIFFFFSLVRFQLSVRLLPIFVGVLMMDDPHQGWTSIFGTSSGENSVGSSEASINQPAPHSPEPVSPEVDQPDGGGPLIPEEANHNHLMPAQERMEELAHRLSINSITKNLSRNEWNGIIAAQIVVEESVEAALVDDGFPPDAILDKRHQIRGFMFYPQGTSLTEKTYASYVTSIDDFGTRASVPYKRVRKAIDNYDLFI